MRHREAFKPEEKKPDALIIEVQRVNDRVTALADRKEAPAIQLIGPDLVDAFVQALDDIHNRPKEIAIEIIRGASGQIVAMVGTTDPEKIAIIIDGGDALGYVKVKLGK